MAKRSVTPATAFLAKHGVAFTEHEFEYLEHGGTGHSSKMMGVPEHAVVKTLIMENEKGDPLVVLMHGDRKVSTKELARSAGVKKIAPCKPEVATRHSGYLIGGTSPFGTRKSMPVYLERSVLELPRIYINGGGRGYLLGMEPAVLTSLLSPVLVDVAIEE
ncbi:MAG TPA: aminoacyl-tRNA deacylase [Usitatibacter sp.]|nr:aminoacyl-tRNA deacylase [Usitatibacter sp.]